MCDSFTLKHIFFTYCESVYGCELFNFTKPYMSKWYISWRKIIRYIFRLSHRTHNYIVSNLINCFIGRLDRRLCKYIYNVLYCDNITVQKIAKYKLLSPTSIFADNYIYLFNKYNIAHSDWYRDMPFITNMICTQYSGCKRNLHMVKWFNIINWIYSILNIQSIYRHMALWFYDVLESI